MKKENYLYRMTINLFPVIFLFFCCNAPPEKEIPTQEKSRSQIEDPYFVLSTDTVSTHGPTNITRNMVQDTNGNMWFATWEGIIRYDGKFFTNLTLKEGLRHFHVFSVLKDKNETLWFGTIGGGVYRFDPASKKFTNITIKDGLVADEIECMLEDKAGNIWFGTPYGASRYDGTKFANFTWLEGLSDNAIHCIAQDATGKLWFGTNDGISCYDERRFTYFTNNETVPFKNVRSIIEDNKGNIWIGSEGEGLCRFDKKALVVIKTDFTSYLFEDRSGNIWFSASAEGRVGTPAFPINGTKNTVKDVMALSYYDGKKFEQIIEKDEQNDFQIFGIFEENTGNIWFGTMKGPCRYDPLKKEITKFD